MNLTVYPLYLSMKTVPTLCINIVLWVWLDEWLSVAWGPVKEVLQQQVMVWFDVGSSVMSRERKESYCDKKRSLFRYEEQIQETERQKERERCCEDKWYWICGVFHI